MAADLFSRKFLRCARLKVTENKIKTTPWMPESSQQRICALRSLKLIQINLFLGAAKQQAPDCLWQETRLITEAQLSSARELSTKPLFSGGWSQQKDILLVWCPLCCVDFLVLSLDLMMGTMPYILKSLSNCTARRGRGPQAYYLYKSSKFLLWFGTIPLETKRFDVASKWAWCG